MGTFADIGAAVNFSVLVGAINERLAAVRSHEYGATAPPNPIDGVIWHYRDGSTRNLQFWNGSAWVAFANLAFVQLNAGGTVAMVADFNCGGNKIVGLEDGTANDHAATVGQVGALLNGTATANRSMGGFRITSLGQPTATGDAARQADTFATSHGLVTHHAVGAGLTFDGGSLSLVECEGGNQVGVSSPDDSFCPRVLTVTLAGNLERTSDSSVVAAMPRTTFTFHRLSSDAAGSYVQTYTFTIGLSQYEISAGWKTGTSGGTRRGFYLRVRRTTDNVTLKASVANATAVGGVGI